MNIRGFWNHKDEALFIELVRQYPPLWNTADRNYSKKSLKKVLYMHIAEELKKRWPDKAHLLSADSMRQKFNALRTYFQKEQRKMKMYDKISTVRSFRKWIHFNKMLFLTEKDGRNESESDLNISIVRVEGGIRNGDKEMEHNDSVAKTSCSNSNKEKDSSLSLQPFVQSNEEAVELSLKREILDDLSVACDSTVTETSVNPIVAKTSCFDGNVGTDSSSLLQSSVQSNEEAVEPSVKIEVPDDPSPVCVSFVTETPVNAIVAEANCSDRNEGTDSSLSLQPSVQSNEEDPDPSLKKRKPNNSSPVYDLIETESPVILKAQSASVQLLPAFNIESGNLVVTSLNQVPTEKANQPMKEMQLNKEAAKPSLKNSTPVHDSFDTEAPITAIVAKTSCFDRNEGTYPSLSLQPSLESIEEAAEPPLKRKKLSNSSPMCDSTQSETPVILKAWSASAQGPPAFNVTLGNLVIASLNQMPTEKANAATKEIFDVLLKYGRETNHLR